jgi:polysaccharide export outer membrane protein
MNKIFFLAIVLAFSSCRLVPNRMFKTPGDYSFAKDTVNKTPGPYIMQGGDKIELHIFSNDGFKLVDITQSNLSQSASDENIVYFVEENGESKLPVIGRIMLKGLSIKDAETLLQEKYSKYYKDPFVLIRVVSRKALVFLSDGGRGVEIPLMNDHTTLFEALALAGGLTDYSKSYHIKIVRGDLKNPQIYLADISSVSGLKDSELEIYPNDIIYIDSGSNFRKRLTTEFLPYLSVFTSVLVLITYVKK